jgi:hypothetical protein
MMDESESAEMDECIQCESDDNARRIVEIVIDVLSRRMSLTAHVSAGYYPSSNQHRVVCDVFDDGDHSATVKCFGRTAHDVAVRFATVTGVWSP